ncbi:MAG: threonine/serine exporter family protein [Spirochaetales bacterium]|nr:threonine/serine exporter family protein [Spirochaetales bacterium]
MILVWTLAATLGFAFLLQCRGWTLLWASLGGVVGWGVYLLMTPLVGPWIAYAVGAAAVTAWAEILSRLSGKPPVSYLLPGLIPMVPGKYIFNAMDLMVRQHFTDAATAGWEAFIVAVALVVGVTSISVLLRRP